VVEPREDRDLPHAFRNRLCRWTDGLHHQFPPSPRIEVAIDEPEGTAGDGTARLERGQVKRRQFGGRGA
jgi:hypothetical protein